MEKLNLETSGLEGDCQVKTSPKVSNYKNEPKSITLCKRCGRKLTSKKSIELGYGQKCYRITQLNEEKHEENVSNDLIQDLINRVKKLELDNNFMKQQIKHKTFTKSSKDSELNWDIPKKVKEVKSKIEIKFTTVVKELKVIFHEGFDYHEILHSINPNEEIVLPPQTITIGGM